MEGGGAYNSKSEQTVEAVSELETVHKLHDDKMSKFQELKGKKEAMKLELEKKRNENPDKTRDFEDLSGIYGSKRDQLFEMLAEKSQVKDE